MAASFHIKPAPELEPGLYQIGAVDDLSGEIISWHIVGIVAGQVITVNIAAGVAGCRVGMAPSVSAQSQGHTESPV